MNQTYLAIAYSLLFCSRCSAVEPPRLVHRWELEPDLGATWVMTPTLATPVLRPEQFSSKLQHVQLSAAQMAIRDADSPLLQGAGQSLPVLLEQLKTKPENRQLQLSLAAAAIALSTPDNAQVLWERLGSDPATRPLIERALINWRQPLAVEIWRERLRDVRASLPDLLLAIEGLGATGNEQDRQALESLLRSDRFSAATKIVVARALAQVAPKELESLAQDVLSANIEHGELLAAELLSQHTTPAASETLSSILKSDSLPARLIAYTAIANSFPDLARELAADMLAQPDNNLRLKAVEVLNRFDDVDSLRIQAIGIADQNIQVRNMVRENLLRKASLPGLRPVVDEIITYQLTSQAYQGIEQAMFLAVALSEHQRTPQLLGLLAHPREETNVIAAWALQELANTPEVTESIFEFTQPITQRLIDSDHVTFPEILRQSFLFEALGRNRHEPATETLKIYVPKNGHKMGDLARASAIWALGKILTGSQDQQLSKQLVQRMLDESAVDPEDDLVKYNSVIALAWIGTPTSAQQVRSFAAFPPAPLGLAREWSLQQFEATTPPK